MPREPGGWEGRVWVADDFDEPLPEEILAGFEGRSNGADDAERPEESS